MWGRYSSDAPYRTAVPRGSLYLPVVILQLQKVFGGIVQQLLCLFHLFCQRGNLFRIPLCGNLGLLCSYTPVFEQGGDLLCVIVK